jgi:hypothetical protein
MKIMPVKAKYGLRFLAADGRPAAVLRAIRLSQLLVCRLPTDFSPTFTNFQKTNILK